MPGFVPSWWQNLAVSATWYWLKNHDGSSSERVRESSSVVPESCWSQARGREVPVWRPWGATSWSWESGVWIVLETLKRLKCQRCGTSAAENCTQVVEVAQERGLHRRQQSHEERDIQALGYQTWNSNIWSLHFRSFFGPVFLPYVSISPFWNDSVSSVPPGLESS